MPLLGATLPRSVPIPFPSAILIRPRALIANLEAVRMIICSNQCYVLSGALIVRAMCCRVR